MRELTRETTYAINPSQVVHETIEGEVILIQLHRGNYYSLLGAGREIWELLCEGHSPAEVSAELGNRYSGDSVKIDSAVDALVSDLLAEELLEVGPASGSTPAAVTKSEGTSRPDFEDPKLEKYTDMQDYLLIDPIHDVTQSGWPSAKPRG